MVCVVSKSGLHQSCYPFLSYLSCILKKILQDALLLSLPAPLPPHSYNGGRCRRPLPNAQCITHQCDRQAIFYLVIQFSCIVFHWKNTTLSSELYQQANSFSFFKNYRYNSWWVLVVCINISVPKWKKNMRLSTLSCHLPVIHWSVLGEMSMWGTIRTMEGGDSSVTLVAILVLQNLYVT